MTIQTIPAIFVTAEHLLIGQAPTRGARLLETLTAPDSEFIHLDDVHLARRESKATRLRTLPRIVLRKRDLLLAVLGGGKHESPETRRFAFVDKRNYPAFLIVSGYEIEGSLQLKGTADPALAISHELKSFVPITHATISHAGGNGEPLAASVVLCNRDHISALHIAEAPRDASLLDTRSSAAVS
ncbi:MAG TPA: hypothetical protein VG826_26885 [Pirellulales bacterium]|nr:hypothetical protein [Pirellulales bacterium]